MSIDTILARQNQDGGWPYLRGGSWTEPTVYAVLAALTAGQSQAAKRGMHWIVRTQNRDGGWRSRPDAGDSSWATGLVALLPVDQLGLPAHQHAIEWLLSATGEESTFLYRLRQKLLGQDVSPDQKDPGWPWTPGAAAWVGPTSIALMALEKEAKRQTKPQLQARISEGKAFLLNRVCDGGGWNHGGVHALGYAAHAYPDTTGIALMAMRGVKSAKIEESLTLAEQYLKTEHTAEAQNWLRLALRAHGKLPAGYRPPEGVAYRTVPEMALFALAEVADKGGEVYLA